MTDKERIQELEDGIREAMGFFPEVYREYQNADDFYKSLRILDRLIDRNTLQAPGTPCGSNLG